MGGARETEPGRIAKQGRRGILAEHDGVEAFLKTMSPKYATADSLEMFSTFQRH